MHDVIGVCIGGGRLEAGIASVPLLSQGRFACNKLPPQRMDGRAFPLNAAGKRALSKARAAETDDIVPFKLADIGEGITGTRKQQIVLSLVPSLLVLR